MNVRRVVAVAFLLLFWSVGAFAQLDEKCTVSILNRNGQVRPDGTWRVDNVPAGFGSVRARATCVHNGVTRSGESGTFEIPAAAVTGFDANIQLGATTPIPELVVVTASLQTLNTPGATSQLLVNGVYAGNQSRNITAASTGTKYTSSNPAIAVVTAEGLVRAVASGTAIVLASNEGASGLTAISVILSADSDGDGIPDDVEIREGLDPNDPTDALLDADLDGLTNGDEVARGTGVNDSDSDDDTISDGEEVVAGADTFVTNPLAADTDGDGVRDALEIETGSDPTNRNSVNLGAAMTRLDVTPPSFTLLINTLVGEAYTQMSAIGTLRDGTTIDLTSTARGTNYATSDVNVCNFGAPDGRVYGSVDGSCTITVSNSGFSDTSAGTVRTFTPSAVSSVSIPGYANNVEVSGGYAFVAAGSAGLQVVSVTDAAHPAVVGSRDTPGTAIDVRIAGRYAYVADGFSGLQILDIINPTAPAIVGGVATNGDAQDVAISENLAFIADGSAGLTIVNVANPTSPIVVGSLGTSGAARGVDVSGSYAVVATDSGIRIINVANPSAPQLAGSIAVAGEPKDVRVSGTTAYIAAYTGGLQVIDFTTPNAPRISGAIPSTFVPRDVELANRFAIFAEQLFPNVVPFVDISGISPVFKGVIDFEPLGDYAGTGIAVDGPFVYMTGESFVVSQDYGTSGNTRLFIGQYLPLEDLAGVPPDISIASPINGSQQFEGAQLTVTAAATDDIAIARVDFSVGGTVAFTDTSAPYAYTLTVPNGVTSLTVRAVAYDLANNNAAAQVTVQVVPDPLTTVSGLVVDMNGAPIVGATVTTNGGKSTVTGPGGAFSIFGVTTVRGDIVATVHYVNPAGESLNGSSPPVPPVRAGITNVGTVIAVTAVFEENIGTFVSSCDDCYYLFTLPFPFTYYGQTWTQVYVGTNGYLTFGSGDSEYTETLPDFNRLPRIAAFFDDLYGRSTGGLYVNSSIPGRFVVTHQTVQHYSFGGSNTLQITIFADGRIQFAYRGITALTTGSITGITPGPGSPFLQVDYSATRTAEAPAGSSVYEYFTDTNAFDLDNGFILFTPRGDGGYSVRTIVTTPPPAVDVQLTGAPAGVEVQALAAASDANASAQNVFAKAEVEVRSSSDPKFRAHANTDHRGAFRLKRPVPAGAIDVVLRRHGKVIGIGSGVFAPAAGKPNTLHIRIDAPSGETKTEPHGAQ